MKMCTFSQILSLLEILTCIPGTLLIKTNRIARIFSRKLFKKNHLRFLSLRSQYMMISSIVLAEIVICLVWEFLLSTPHIVYSYGLTRDAHTMTCVYGEKMLGLGLYTIYNVGELRSTTAVN